MPKLLTVWVKTNCGKFFETKVRLVKAMVFPVVMYECELDSQESWAPKNWCIWTVVLEKTLESPLDWKEIQPVHPKGNEAWIVIGRTDAEAETPILLPPDEKNLLIWKDPDAGKGPNWERLKAEGEGDNRGWNGWMASPTWWTWVWASSGSWWWTGRPGVLQPMGSQNRTLSDWTELNKTELIYNIVSILGIQQSESVIYIYVYKYIICIINVYKYILCVL